MKLILSFSCFLLPFFLVSQDYFFYGEQLGDKIFRSNLDGSNIETIVTGQGILRRMRIDFVEEKLFWVEGETGRMWKSNFDGTSQEIIIDLPTSNLNLIEIDKTNQRIFYTITNDGFIRSIDLNGSNQEIIVSGVGNVQGLEYDPFCDKLYWTEFVEGVIKRANGDGTDIETIVDLNSKPFDLILDIESEKLFFNDRQSSNIHRANMDGSDLEVIVDQTGDKGAMTLDFTNDRLYWVNNTQEVIYSSDLDGSNINTIIVGDPAQTILAGIIVYVPFTEDYEIPTFELPDDTTICLESGTSFTLAVPQDLFASQEWQDGSTADIYEVTSIGTYWVRAETIPGCAVSDTIEVEIFENEELILEDTILLLCEESFLEININSTYNSVVWQDTFASNGSPYIITESGTYWVSAISENDCPVEDTITVLWQPTVDDILGTDTTICPGTLITLGEEINSAEYLWQNSSIDPFIVVGEPGIYWVEITTDNGCILTDSIEVNLWPTIDINLGNDTSICEGEQIILESPIGNTMFIWQDGTTTSSYVVSSSGTYWLSVETSEGCIISDTIGVQVFGSEELILLDTAFLCESNFLDIEIDPIYSPVIWQDTVITNELFTISEPGIYWVSGLASSDCLLRDTIVVLESRVLDVLDLDTMICSGSSLEIGQEIEGATYSWQDGSTEPFFEVTDSGIYWIEVLLEDRCIQIDTIEINFWPAIEIDLGNDTTICEGERILLEGSTGLTSYIWQDSSQLPYYEVQEAGFYSLEVEENGCIAKDSIIIETIDCTFCNIYIPNVFSPNADGLNDTFSAYSNCTFGIYNLQIFNRWGAVVFQSSDVQDTWDGTFKGEHFTPDVFVYALEFSFNEGQEMSIMRISGDITILK